MLGSLLTNVSVIKSVLILIMIYSLRTTLNAQISTLSHVSINAHISILKSITIVKRDKQKVNWAAQEKIYINLRMETKS